jgi:hypothetical protein
MPGHKILASIADIKTIICTYNFTLDVPLNTGTYYNNAEILKCLNFLLIVYVGSATSSSEYNSVHTIIVALDDKLNIKLVSNNPIYAHLWRYANRTLG